MRNLKKILAMVLALVMSLSLMATAGASSFPDVDDDNPYATAIEVLDELKVFQGYKEDGTFRPTETLNRAQAAVLVYRIATGDVEDKYLDNYTYMQQSKFTDLDGYNWAKGYINYCQNAGIVVGTTATTFDPGAKVTGYQLLVMLLRTLGYGKAGEFADPKGWELQTAAIAEREGITKNVTTGDFGAPAPRQMVAEILFRGLLTPTVEYSPLTPNGYTKSVTLGKRELGLEEITGVVVANEFADLYDVDVLPEGKTQVKVEGEDKTRTLNYGTLITDIGESRLIYTQNTARVLYMADTGDNVVKQYGEGVDIGNSNKFQSVAEMAQTSGTEFFQNFSTTGYYTSDFRLEYVIEFTSAYDGAANAADYNVAAEFTSGTTTSWSTDGRTLHRVIPATQRITLADYSNMLRIFTRSNGQTGTSENTTNAGVYDGKVFVGTQTAKDISDEISFVAFEADYLKPIAYDKSWGGSRNGQWVKFIDNNNDGNCEYAFWTNYWLDEVISTYKKNNTDDEYVMQYNRFRDSDPTRYMNGAEAIDRDVAVGDIVLAAYIDGQYLVSEPEMVTTSATSYNYRTDSITAADGETYGQSGIGNATTMSDRLSLMAPKTEYEMFLDKFGFVRAYRQPGGTKYALVTELYYTNNNNGNLVRDWPMTVELTMPDEDGKLETKEYNLANVSGNSFRALTPWTLIGNYAMQGNLYNWLQPATAHLGIPSAAVAGSGLPYEVRTAPTLDTTNNGLATYWPANNQITQNVKALGAGSGEFNYDEQLYRNPSSTGSWTKLQDNTVSFTNVAVVGIDGDNATLNSAAKLNRSTSSGLAESYAVDYIELTLDRPAKGAASYKVANSATYNQYVNADRDTEIYVVYNDGVQYFKGYENMPALTESLVGRIHAAYTVARNTNTGTSAQNYWMADVIVYEVEKWDDLAKASISLAYFTALQQMQSVNGVTVNTLNSKTDPAKVDLVPSGMDWGTGSNWWSEWGNSWKGYGFYQLYNTTDAVDGVMTARKIEAISKDFNDYGIWAGTVTREIETAPAGYIPVNMTGATTVVNGETILATEALVSVADGKVYSVTNKYDTTNTTTYYMYTDAETLQYNNVRWSQVKADDRVIWVGGGAQGTVPNASSFVVDLGNDGNVDPLLDNKALRDATPVWLGGTAVNNATTIVNGSLWSAIIAEQKVTPPTNTIKITFKYEPLNSADKTDWMISAKLPSVQSQTVVKGTAATYVNPQVQFVIPGWDVNTMTVAYTDGVGTPSNSSYSSNTLTIAALDTTKDITVTVKYTKATIELTPTLNTMGAGVTVNYNIPTATTKTGTVSSGTAIGAGMAYGDTATLTWTGAAHTTYALSGANAEDFTINGTKGGTWTVTGTVKGASAITITGTADSTTTVAKPATDAVVTAATVYAADGSAAPANFYAGDKFGVGLTIAPSNTVSEVYWTEQGSLTRHPMTKVATTPTNVTETTGFWVSDEPIGEKSVQVFVVTHPDQVTVTFAVDGSYTGTWSAANGVNTITSASALDPMAYNGTVNVEGSAAMWLKVTTGDASDIVIPAASLGQKTAALTNVTGDVTITIYGTEAAYKA